MTSPTAASPGLVVFKLLAHISPITWDNVILYGEYVLDKTKIRL